MVWRQDHKIPEPLLVLSGLSYLLPSYIAYTAGFNYSLFSSLFLTFTTVGFHGTREQWLFELDCIAIINYNICAIYNVYKVGYPAGLIWFVSVSYSLLSYFGGQQLNVMSFDPDWNTQMVFHALIHLSTAYCAYFCFVHRITSSLLQEGQGQGQGQGQLQEAVRPHLQ